MPPFTQIILVEPRSKILQEVRYYKTDLLVKKKNGSQAENLKICTFFQYSDLAKVNRWHTASNMEIVLRYLKVIGLYLKPFLGVNSRYKNLLTE